MSVNVPHARVETLLREAAEQIVMPLWRNLGWEDVTDKSAGEPKFAVMVCLIQSGVTIGAWILNPIDGLLTRAERGGGAFEGSERLARESTRLAVDPSPISLDRARGVAMTWYLPDSQKLTAEAGRDSFLFIERTRCAGYNYPSFVKNELHFLFFYRTLVRDHTPGVLIAQEAGGLVRRLDGTEYTPVDDRKGLLCANVRPVSVVSRGDTATSG